MYGIGFMGCWSGVANHSPVTNDQLSITSPVALSFSSQATGIGRFIKDRSESCLTVYWYDWKKNALSYMHTVMHTGVSVHGGLNPWSHKRCMRTIGYNSVTIKVKSPARLKAALCSSTPAVPLSQCR